MGFRFPFPTCRTSLIRLLPLATAIAFTPGSGARPISEILSEKDALFDPWDQEKWAAWYKDGHIVEPFEIDRPATFAPRDTPWVFSTARFGEIHGKASAIFPIVGTGPWIIDGNNVTLDVRTDAAKAMTIRDWYTNDYKGEQLVDRVHGFKFRQKGTAASPSILRNITLMGFWRAVDTAYTQENPPVHLENITARFNICAFYTNGPRGVIRNCHVTESIMMGIYADQESNGWLIENNTFRDNGMRGVRSWSAITLDSCYNYDIRNNRFLAPTSPPRDYHSAITLYRNQGEKGDIREPSASWNLISENTFQGYHQAIDAGIRMGRRASGTLANLAMEGRCYVDYNTIRGNTFDNCVIGVLLRTGFNAVDANRFDNVKTPIALVNAFRTLQHNRITNQENDEVAIWSDPGQYPDYVKYVSNHNEPGLELGSGIKPQAKFYHVISPEGRPKFRDPGAATLVVADQIAGLPEDGGTPDYNLFPTRPGQAGNLGFTNKPIDIAVGKFAAARPAGDFAVIFDRPGSRVGRQDYYSIILYDQNGAEFERCGRSRKRWSRIAAGNFLRDTGARLVNGNHEVAAVSSEPDENGCYPVYVFRKGIAEPAAVLMDDNRMPVKALAAGRFTNHPDGYAELAVILEGSSRITLIKPSDKSWSRTIEAGDTALSTVATGEFNGNPADGDEIAALSESAGPILLFKTGHPGAYATTGPAAPWKLLSAGGAAQGANGTRQLAAIRADSPGEIHFFEAGSAEALRTTKHHLPGGMPVRFGFGDHEKTDAPEPETNGRFTLGGLHPGKATNPEVRLAILPKTAPASVPVLVWAPLLEGAPERMTVVPILK